MENTIKAFLESRTQTSSDGDYASFPSNGGMQYLRYGQNVIAERDPNTFQIKVFNLDTDQKYTLAKKKLKELLVDDYIQFSDNNLYTLYVNYEARKRADIILERNQIINETFYVHTDFVNGYVVPYVLYKNEVYVDTASTIDKLIDCDESKKLRSDVAKVPKTSYDIVGGYDNKAINNITNKLSKFYEDDFDPEQFYISRLLINCKDLTDIIDSYFDLFKPKYREARNIKKSMEFTCDILNKAKHLYITSSDISFPDAIATVSKESVSGAKIYIDDQKKQEEPQEVKLYLDPIKPEEKSNKLTNEDDVNEIIDIYNQTEGVKKITEMVSKLGDHAAIEFARKAPWVIDFEKVLVDKLLKIIDKLMDDNEKLSDMAAEIAIGKYIENGRIVGDA